MSAGQVWQRTDGLVWVEVQRPELDASGWRLMVPLVDPYEAIDAPPLVVPAADGHARVHLLTSVPADELGTPLGALSADDLAALQTAVASMVGA